MKLLKPIVLALAVLLLTGNRPARQRSRPGHPRSARGHVQPILRADRSPPGTCCFYGALVICGTLGISLYLRTQIHKLPAHKSMLDVAEIIFQTCKTYLIQQGKFLLMLFVLIAVAITYYLLGFGHEAERRRGAPSRSARS